LYLSTTSNFTKGIEEGPPPKPSKPILKKALKICQCIMLPLCKKRQYWRFLDCFTAAFLIFLSAATTTRIISTNFKFFNNSLLTYLNLRFTTVMKVSCVYINITDQM